MKVKFSRCNSNSLANVPQVDGQLIYVKDTSEVYMDVGNNRNKLSDVIEVADITNVQNPIISKIYYDKATENLYKYIDNEWKSLGGSATPQIYFWDGNQQTGLTFWNNIMKINEDNDVVVLYTFSDFNLSAIIKIPQGAIKTKKVTNWYDYYDLASSSSNMTYSAMKARIKFTIENDVITTYTIETTTVASMSLLETNKDYATPYVPLYDGSPATKKYVDDKTKPEVYYWDGKTNQTGLDFWTNIFEVNKTQSVCVIWKQPHTSAVGTYMGYLSVNELPTNKFLYGWLLTQTENANLSYHSYYLQQLLSFTWENDVVTQIASNTIHQIKMLNLDSNYSQPYIPQYPGSPATKKYVDDKVFYLPISSSDTTTVTWGDLYNAYNSNNIIVAKIDYLSNSILVPITAPLYGMIGDQTGGTVIFTFVMGMKTITYTVTGTGENVCTITKQDNGLEILSNKAQSVISNNTSQDKYPSTKAVFDEFQRRPVIVWQSNTPSEYLKAIQADLSASPTWQLTNLDLTAFKSIKIYSCAGQGTGATASASTTPSIVLEMSLDPRAAIAAYGGNYVTSVVVQKPNDNNRLATLTCVVSADKTKFTVLRQTSLYGTAATSNNDVNANVFMIEGYYADGVTLPDGDNTQY